MQFDFTAQQVTGETTRPYIFDLIPGSPGILLSPAHDSNPDFLDARLRRAIEDSERAKREARENSGKPRTKTTVEELKRQDREARESDRVILSTACARGWTTPPVATDGSTPEFSPENCYAFFKALPDYLFDGLRAFSSNLYNFVDTPPISDEQAADAGN